MGNKSTIHDAAEGLEGNKAEEAAQQAPSAESIPVVAAVVSVDEPTMPIPDTAEDTNEGPTTMTTKKKTTAKRKPAAKTAEAKKAVAKKPAAKKAAAEKPAAKKAATPKVAAVADAPKPRGRKVDLEKVEQLITNTKTYLKDLKVARKQAGAEVREATKMYNQALKTRDKELKAGVKPRKATVPVTAMHKELSRKEKAEAAVVRSIERGEKVLADLVAKKQKALGRA